ncbi:methylmalonyl-CoA mutase subunit beta [Robertmurraya mangrovi]|nr:methylmalonyl-CoA mutase subunit beta [Bacillus sp. 31A1R]
MLQTTFEEATTQNWVQKGEETLKGKSIESLSRNTYENIKLKPLYSREDQNLDKVSQYPSQADFRRGKAALGYVSSEWKVAQQLVAETVEDLQNELRNALERGQTAISFEVNKELLNHLSDTLKEYHGKFAYSLDGKNYQSLILNELKSNLNPEQGTGYIGKDPIALYVQGVLDNHQLDEAYTSWGKTIEDTDKTMPNIRTILVNTTPFHNGGANAIQELAIAISSGVHHIDQLAKNGLGIDKVLSKMVFEFSIGANFFMEIAKLRAARILWAKVAEAYGAQGENLGMEITARTSQFTKTVFDPYVNMLRAGNEAFAAVLGNIQYLHVSPFNEPEGNPTSFSNRMARNTQLILKEETHLSNIVDPAGGSWYIEQLTNELAQKAWELFLELEDKGGVANSLKTGWLQEQIQTVKEKRTNDIATRKQSIVGTNVYANLQDQPLHVREERVKHSIIPQDRLSEPYEQLRLRAETLKSGGKEVAIGLLCIGKLKEYKPRADFITGFLAAGGIQSLLSGEIESTEQALDFIKASNNQQFFICSSDDKYKEIGLAMLKELNEQCKGKQFYLAGLPSESDQTLWLENGIKQFVHIKSNCYETLSTLLSEMEGNINE